MITLQDLEKMFKEKDINYDIQGDRLYYLHHSKKENVRMNVISFVDGSTFCMLIYAMNAGEKTEAMRTAIEKANENYKYWKFSLDRDNDLVMEFQTPAEYINDTEIYIDMVLIAASIIDDFYPKFQRARFAAPAGGFDGSLD